MAIRHQTTQHRAQRPHRYGRAHAWPVPVPDPSAPVQVSEVTASELPILGDPATCRTARLRRQLQPIPSLVRSAVPVRAQRRSLYPALARARPGPFPAPAQVPPRLQLLVRQPVPALTLVPDQVQVPTPVRALIQAPAGHRRPVSLAGLPHTLRSTPYPRPACDSRRIPHRWPRPMSGLVAPHRQDRGVRCPPRRRSLPRHRSIRCQPAPKAYERKAPPTEV